jgi:hypothetical protein
MQITLLAFIKHSNDILLHVICKMNLQIYLHYTMTFLLIYSTTTNLSYFEVIH